MKKSLIFFFVGAFWLSISGLLIANPAAVSAANEYTPLDFQPQIGLPFNGLDQPTKVGTYDSNTGSSTSNLLARYVKGFYDYGMMIVGILAALVLMGGGVLWLTSGGDSSKITQAKELIAGSLLGSAILFGSWIILNTINPDLLKLKSIEMKVSQLQNFDIGCCTDKTSGKSKNSTQKECGANTFSSNQLFNQTTGTCEDSGCCVQKIQHTASGGTHDNPTYTSTIECSQNTQSNCTQVNTFELTSTFERKTCVQLEACRQATKISCEDKANGESCSSSGDGYCYNRTCLQGDGNKEGDPCGTTGGQCTSKAHLNFSQLVFDTVLCDEPNHYEDNGGRDCGTGLYCCYQKTN
ncbi:MAG: pilin [Patescibacteria group bacterium]